MPAPSTTRRRWSIRRSTGVAAAALLLLALTAAACGSDAASDASSEAGGSDGTSTTIGDATADVVRLGYFPNVTHAPALVGVAQGFFTDHLTWRWAFWVNIPVAVVVLLVAGAAIPSLAKAARPVIDYAGIVFVGLGASGLTLASAISGITVYSANVDVPMKWRSGSPSRYRRVVPSGR